MPVDDGVALVAGARDLLLAAAGSLPEAPSVARAPAERPPSGLGGRDSACRSQDGFVATARTRPTPRPMQTPADDRDGEDDVPERGIVRSPAEALQATRRAIDGMAAGGQHPD